MKQNQLEISLMTPPCRRPSTPRARRASRARWWFGQMRRVVNEAMEWRPSPSLRPEQIHLSLPSRW